MNETTMNTDEGAQNEQVIQDVDTDGSDENYNPALALLEGDEGDDNEASEGETSTSDESGTTENDGTETDNEADSLEASATGERAETGTETSEVQDSDSSEGTDESESKEASELGLDEIVAILRAGDEVPEGANKDLVRGANAIIESDTTKKQYETLKTKVIKDPYTLLTDEQKAQIEECEATEGKHAAFNLTKKFCDEVTKEAVEMSPEMRKEAVRIQREEFITKLAKDSGIPTSAFNDEMPIGIYRKIEKGDITWEVGMAQAAKHIRAARGLNKKLIGGNAGKSVEKAPKIRSIKSATVRPGASEVAVDNDTAAALEMLGLN